MMYSHTPKSIEKLIVFIIYNWVALIQHKNATQVVEYEPHPFNTYENTAWLNQKFCPKYMFQCIPLL